MGALTRTPLRAVVALAACLWLGSTVLVTGVRVSDSLVAVRPRGLPALEVEARIFELFGGKSQPFIVLVADRDRDAAMQRADAIAESLGADESGVVERVDALVPVLPAEATQRARLAERDALDLPGRAAELEKALEETGFAVPRFESFLSAMRAPPAAVARVDDALEGKLGVLASRYLAEEGGEHLVTLHAHTVRGAEQRDALQALVHAVDPAAAVTGYARLEADLRDALARDLPRISLVAGALVVVLLAASLRRAGEVLIAGAVLVTGIGALLGAASLLGAPLHVYSALVVPVLLGISVDEAMFLLHEGRRAAPGEDPTLRALRVQGPPVVATALTTSAGFVALATSGYEGLRDLGLVGALGNAAILVVALVLVPAGTRLLRPASDPRRPR